MDRYARLVCDKNLLNLQSGTFPSCGKCFKHSAPKVQQQLGRRIDAALAATPNLVASYKEDIDDAFEYVGLRNMDNPYPAFRRFRETAAAEASYGFGMCQNYTDRDGCEAELLRFPQKNVLSILYTRNSLCVELGATRTPYWFWPYFVSPPSMDFSLGSDEIHNNPDESYYWASVQDTIWRGLSLGFSMHYRPVVIFLFGESAHHEKFRSVLEDALKRLLGDELPPILDDNLVFQTARGAADLAKRGRINEW